MTSLKEIQEECSDDEEHFMGEIATIGELSAEDYTIEHSIMKNDHPGVSGLQDPVLEQNRSLAVPNLTRLF